MPNIYSDTGDGYIVGPTVATWAGARDATTGASVDTAHTSSSSLVAVSRFSGRTGGNTYRVTRSFFTFNVSSITGTVTDASLYIYGASGLTVGSIWGVKGGTPLLGGLAVSQFDDMPGYSAGASMLGNVTQYTSIIAGAGWVTSSYNKMQGTSDLMTDIQDEGTIVIVLTDYLYDARNAAPASNGTWSLGGHYTDYSGTSRDPYIEYTLAAGYGHEVNTVAAVSIGKVNTVATANIGKINTVD
jgi:hypothetical protein